MERSALQVCQKEGCLHMRESRGRRNREQLRVEGCREWHCPFQEPQDTLPMGTGYCQTGGFNSGCHKTPASPRKIQASSLGFGFSSCLSLLLLFHHKFFNKSLQGASTFVAACRCDFNKYHKEEHTDIYVMVLTCCLP